MTEFQRSLVGAPYWHCSHNPTHGKAFAAISNALWKETARKVLEGRRGAPSSPPAHSA